jgi:hypothetical protein
MIKTNVAVRFKKSSNARGKCDPTFSQLPIDIVASSPNLNSASTYDTLFSNEVFELSTLFTYLRKKKNLSIKKFAEKIGMTNHGLSKFEDSGLGRIKDEHISNLKTLDTDMSWVIDIYYESYLDIKISNID